MSQDQITAIVKALENIESRMETRFDILEKKVDLLREDVRKVLKFVPIENADFTPVTLPNGKTAKQKVSA